MHVMDSEELMIDQTLDEIEESPATEHRAEQHATGPHRIGATSGAEEQTDADGSHGPGYRMEEAVPDHVVLHRNERRGRDAAREHVVPLQDLVEEDSIEKAAEADA
jgi:hypothetical protein